MSIIDVVQKLNNAPWAQQVVVNVSRGKGDWAKVKNQYPGVTLSAWFNGQVGTVREGAMTADEYVTADKDSRNGEKAKAGWYSFAAYAGDHRDSKNWQGSNIVVVDADAKYGKEEGAEYSFTAAQVRARLDGLQFIALPSHSYTEEIPRWRIVIPLSEEVTNRDEFSAIARLLAGRLDGYVDPRTYTPEQLWFSMSAPKGEWHRRVGQIVVGG